ncbi:hypothetical protein HY642_06340 [Candidatus Woesearchaeota archaeon]|nr:hypothetical protein [Candidatus Woesearchaeota archaeon]
MPELVFQERPVVKEDLRCILLELQSELRRVPQTDVIAVSQVAEKAWVAFVTYVKAASPEGINTHAAVIDNAKRLVRKDASLKHVWYNAEGLHRFHYAPFVEDVRGGLYTVLQTIEFVLRELKKRAKALPSAIST